MMQSEELIGIYQYHILDGEGQPDLFLMYLFDKEGLVDSYTCQKIYLEQFSNGMDSFEYPGYIGPFSSLENLNQFAYGICQRLDANKITLLSSDEFNKAFDASKDTENFCSELKEYGNQIQNIEKKKGSFLNLFK